MRCILPMQLIFVDVHNFFDNFRIFSPLQIFFLNYFSDVFKFCCNYFQKDINMQLVTAPSRVSDIIRRYFTSH